ncbi:MAG: hypothetical protein JEY99_04285 [Spirochaetales bacterium]|nr:hypothetical protein [Spirochaetales bacterium]
MLFSILFLVFMFGIPVTMVVLVIVMIRRRSGAVSGLISLAESRGWAFTKSGREHPLNGILTGGLFTTRPGGTHSINNIIQTKQDLWFCDYQYTGPGPNGKRRSSYYTLAVGERRDEGPNLWIVRRQNGPLGRLAEAFASGQLHPVPGEQWAWMLTSSVEDFERAGWLDPVPDVLEKRMVPGGGLFLLGKYLILSAPGALDKEQILKLKDDMEMIRDIL